MYRLHRSRTTSSAEHAEHAQLSMRKISAISAFSALIVTAALTVAADAQLPTQIPQTKFSSGQDIAPYFEGWLRNPDGTFDMVFGYFNRNWKEEVAVPAGPDNEVQPGGPDRGQPTYF